jgi:hypothetical protein
MKVTGPFEVTHGPKPKIICIWCRKPVALRNAPDGVYLLMCSRIICEAERPRNHPFQEFQ